MAITARAARQVGVFVDGVGGRGRSVLLVDRGAGGVPAWDIPAVALAEGEPPEVAAARAVKDQTGLDAGKMYRVFNAEDRLARQGGGELLFEAPLPEGEIQNGHPFSPHELPPKAAFVDAATAALVARWVAAKWGWGLPLNLDDTVIQVDGADLVTGYWPGKAEPPPYTVEGKGQWSMKDGKTTVVLQTEGPTALWLDPWVRGDQLIILAARTPPAYEHDINCIWEGSGSYGPQMRGRHDNRDMQCTIGSIGGWYSELAGIEYFANGPVGVTGLVPVEAERVYYVAAGRYHGSDFLFVDGRCVTDLSRVSTFRRHRSKVALSTYGYEKDQEKGRAAGAHVEYLGFWAYRARAGLDGDNDGGSTRAY